MSDHFLHRVLNAMADSNAFNAQTPGGERCFSWSCQTQPGSNALLISGPNTSGKSLFNTYLEGQCQKADIINRSVSMANRTLSGPEKALIFGHENKQSTGATSVRVVTLCMNASAQEVDPWVAIFDEPDIGLSESYQKAMGAYIGQFMADHRDNPACKGIILVSHSKALMREAAQHARACNQMYMDQGTTLDAWLAREEAAFSVADLLALKERGKVCRTAVSNSQKAAQATSSAAETR